MAAADQEARNVAILVSGARRRHDQLRGARRRPRPAPEPATVGADRPTGRVLGAGADMAPRSRGAPAPAAARRSPWSTTAAAGCCCRWSTGRRHGRGAHRVDRRPAARRGCPRLARHRRARLLLMLAGRRHRAAARPADQRPAARGRRRRAPAPRGRPRRPRADVAAPRRPRSWRAPSTGWPSAPPSCWRPSALPWPTCRTGCGPRSRRCAWTPRRSRDPELAARLREHIAVLQRTIDAIVKEARRPVRTDLAARCDAGRGRRQTGWRSGRRSPRTRAGR